MTNSYTKTDTDHFIDEMVASAIDLLEKGNLTDEQREFVARIIDKTLEVF